MVEITTRNRILEAAAALLREEGAAGASARAVCARAKVKAPALYHHFGDMGRLRAAVVERAFEEAARRKADVPACGDALGDIRHGWDQYVAFALAEPNLFAVISHEMTSGTLPQVALRSYERLLADVTRLAEGRGGLRVAVEDAAQLLWAAAHGAACLHSARGSGFAAVAGLSAGLREATLAFLLGAPRVPT